MRRNKNQKGDISIGLSMGTFLSGLDIASIGKLTAVADCVEMAREREGLALHRDLLDRDGDGQPTKRFGIRRRQLTSPDSRGRRAIEPPKPARLRSASWPPAAAGSNTESPSDRAGKNLRRQFGQRVNGMAGNRNPQGSGTGSGVLTGLRHQRLRGHTPHQPGPGAAGAGGNSSSG